MEKKCEDICLLKVMSWFSTVLKSRILKMSRHSVYCLAVNNRKIFNKSPVDTYRKNLPAYIEETKKTLRVGNFLSYM